MSSLAECPELVGFFSYSRDDDEDSDKALSRLATSRWRGGGCLPPRHLRSEPWGSALRHHAE
jgi:hypothetical protein